MLVSHFDYSGTAPRIEGWIVEKRSVSAGLDVNSERSFWRNVSFEVCVHMKKANDEIVGGHEESMSWRGGRSLGIFEVKTMRPVRLPVTSEQSLQKTRKKSLGNRWSTEG